jgi:hypothetical protein
MASKREVARQALVRIPNLNLHPRHVDGILDALAAEGIIDGNGGVVHAAATVGLNRIERVQAESKINSVVAAALKFAGGQLSQCGSSLNDILNDAGDDVSMSKLNSVIANKSPEWRINCRTALARAGLID